MALYDPTRFEPLIDEPWVPSRVEDAISAIVADADAAFDPEALWPAHEWDGFEEPLPLKSLYAGAAGVIWALDALHRGGHVESSLDLVPAALRTIELKRMAPDFAADEHYHPASLLSGETGPLLVAFRLTYDSALADDLHALVRDNVDNPTDDISWGAPGMLLVAMAMHDWTGEPRWLEAGRESAAALRAAHRAPRPVPPSSPRSRAGARGRCRSPCRRWPWSRWPRPLAGSADRRAAGPRGGGRPPGGPCS